MEIDEIQKIETPNIQLFSELPNESNLILNQSNETPLAKGIFS